MPVGYNVIQPNGIVKKQRVQSDEERRAAVDEQLQRWSEYCNRNWISVNYGDPFCPENKVKLFLNGLAYFLMLGNTGGIVTDYKRVADGKREIPISSCPSYVEDLVYGTGSTLMPANDDEDAVFQATLERLDEKAKKLCPHDKRNARKTKAVSKTRYDKIQKIKSIIGPADFFYPIVDTDNIFSFNGSNHRIDDLVSGYSGKRVGDCDVLYDMDKIICAVCPDGQTYYFDMNMEAIPNEYIHDAD